MPDCRSLTISKEPAAKNARYVVIGSRATHRQVVLLGPFSFDTSRPLEIACFPAGTVILMSKRALSDGWSLAGNQYGAMCGSLTASTSSIARSVSRLAANQERDPS